MEKGSLEIRYIVLLALAVIVLILVILIFHSGVTDFFERLNNLAKEIWSLKPSLK